MAGNEHEVLVHARRALGDHWQPAPLLARLAAEGRGFHDAATPATAP